MGAKTKDSFDERRSAGAEFRVPDGMFTALNERSGRWVERTGDGHQIEVFESRCQAGNEGINMDGGSLGGRKSIERYVGERST